MTQVAPYGTASDKYRRALYVHNGIEFEEVGGALIEPYTSPQPQLKVKELEILNGPAHIHQMGISSYKAEITLLFRNKGSYTRYLSYLDKLHKFTDERGNIWLGVVESAPKVTKYESFNKYVVELSFIFERKAGWETEREVYFQDLENMYGKEDILEMAKLGLVATKTYDGQPVLYFAPADYMTRGEVASVLNRTRKWIEGALRK